MIEILKSVAPGENTLRADEDVASGDPVLPGGRVLGPAGVGVLAGLGVTDVEVFSLPVVAVLSTGDELVPIDRAPGPGRIRDVNSHALSAAVLRAGCVPVSCGIVGDRLELLLKRAESALAGCDALIVSGGSSAGTRDLTVRVLDELGPPGVIAHGLYLKPGKPTLVAVCGGKPAFGLPGNPASALAVFREVVRPVLGRLRGESETPYGGVRREVQAVLDFSVASATGRVELLPVVLTSKGGDLHASPVTGKSNLIGTLARADGNVRIPKDLEGIEKGQTVTVELLD